MLVFLAFIILPHLNSLININVLPTILVLDLLS